MIKDEIQFTVESGKGGDGIVHWRREKYVPKGGPNGGDGGKGGDLYMEAIEDITCLSRYQRNKVYSAEKGEDGKKALMHGKNGKDLTLYIPKGSHIFNESTGEKFELLEAKEKVLIAAGGLGGYGNDHFKSSRNTTPTKATKGTRGQKYTIKIELSLIGDIGIIGIPSAGKSTFLNLVTNANAKTASYHFTTLSPNLGVIHNLIFADIPGLIEGASEGKGLGHKFLKHITRTKLLLHMIPFDTEDIKKTYLLIRKELGHFEKDLLEKEEIILLTKTDLVDKEFIDKSVKEMSKYGKVLSISMYDDPQIKKVIDEIIKIYRKKVV